MHAHGSKLNKNILKGSYKEIYIIGITVQNQNNGNGLCKRFYIERSHLYEHLNGHILKVDLSSSNSLPTEKIFVISSYCFLEFCLKKKIGDAEN